MSTHHTSSAPGANTEAPYGAVEVPVDPQTTSQSDAPFTSRTEQEVDWSALRATARQIVGRYPEGRSRSALLPLLHLVQSVEGYVSPRGVAFCADTLGLTKAEVGGVATFYTMFKRRPTGDYLVSVCTNTMCGILGGQRSYDELSQYLGVGHNETAPAVVDGGPAITLEHAECLAACDYAPVLTINYEYFDQVDAESALDLVRRLQAGERPQPTRGARLCTFKEISYQLAGFADDRPGAVSDGPAGQPTLAGLQLAAEAEKQTRTQNGGTA